MKCKDGICPVTGMTVLEERVEAIVRSIMSGNNACGSLLDAAAKGDAEYFRLCIRATLSVYDDELKQAKADRDAALKDAELKRYALGTVVSNCDISNPLVKEALRNALPNHPLLK